jgi:hypothetical protein
MLAAGSIVICETKNDLRSPLGHPKGLVRPPFTRAGVPTVRDSVYTGGIQGYKGGGHTGETATNVARKAGNPQGAGDNVGNVTEEGQPTQEGPGERVVRVKVSGGITLGVIPRIPGNTMV